MCQSNGAPGRLWKRWALHPVAEDPGPEEWPWDVEEGASLPIHHLIHLGRSLAGGRLLRRESSDLDQVHTSKNGSLATLLFLLHHLASRCCSQGEHC